MNKKLNKLVLGTAMSFLALTANASTDNSVTSLKVNASVTSNKIYNGFYGYSRAEAEQKFLAWANGRDASYYCRTTYPGEMQPGMWLCTGYVY